MIQTCSNNFFHTCRNEISNIWKKKFNFKNLPEIYQSKQYATTFDPSNKHQLLERDILLLLNLTQWRRPRNYYKNPSRWNFA